MLDTRTPPTMTDRGAHRRPAARPGEPAADLRRPARGADAQPPGVRLRPAGAGAREDKTVIGGHQRLLAARRLGYKTVPVDLPRPDAGAGAAAQPRAQQDQRRLGPGAARPAAGRPQARRGHRPVALRLQRGRAGEAAQVAGRAARSGSASSRSTSTPRWRPHVRHHAPNVASSGRWATTALMCGDRLRRWRRCAAARRQEGSDGLHRPALQRRPRRPRRPAARPAPAPHPERRPAAERVGGLRPRLGAQPPRQRRRRPLHLHEHEGVAARLPRPRRGRRALERHDHLGQGPLRPRPGRLPAPVRADLVRLARRRQALLVRRPRPGRRLEDRPAVGLRRCTRR